MSHSRSGKHEVIVVGAGHAGCEAALATARLGAKTLVVTANTDHIGHMPCNCSIGGPAKGHLVREIDALGGEMGRNIDATYTHIRLLNTSKGPAVQSLRAQADTEQYAHRLGDVLRAQSGVVMEQGEVVAFEVDRGRIRGVVTSSGHTWHTNTAIVTVGTFLNGVVRLGELSFPAGRAGDPPAAGLSESYRKLGFEVKRLKTGTVPRVHRDTIDLREVTVQSSDQEPRWFSFENLSLPRKPKLLDCWATHTTAETAAIARENLHRSALYGGYIEGIGPRYCPSIEDKFVKFPERQFHPLFLEQEGWDRDHVYVAGLSNSLPVEIQEKLVHSVPALRHAQVLRPGYAIEYDFVPPTQLKPSLETKQIAGLFHAGQINGTSGYEEAGAQGLLAGLNAVAYLGSEEPLVLNRAEAYAGVMVDDLVTKGADEPYRMFTSRAEFRLLLRQGNADRRLTPHGWRRGLISGARWAAFAAKEKAIEAEIAAAERTSVRPRAAQNETLVSVGSVPIRKTHTVAELMRRPEITFDMAWSVCGQPRETDPEVAREVEVEVRYEGYLQRQVDQRDRLLRHEGEEIPPDFDYASIPALRREAIERFSKVCPSSLGQAARIPGVTPADLSVLSVHLHRWRQRAEAGEWTNGRVGHVRGRFT
jgi:tRNA uridine 5-carboxymethylaminomethyl modification enzyme